jgi:hypothetical protein
MLAYPHPCGIRCKELMAEQLWLTVFPPFLLETKTSIVICSSNKPPAMTESRKWHSGANFFSVVEDLFSILIQ